MNALKEYLANFEPHLVSRALASFAGWIITVLSAVCFVACLAAPIVAVLLAGKVSIGAGFVYLILSPAIGIAGVVLFAIATDLIDYGDYA